jgi:hypothetical protein
VGFSVGIGFPFIAKDVESHERRKKEKLKESGLFYDALRLAVGLFIYPVSNPAIPNCAPRFLLVA